MPELELLLQSKSEPEQDGYKDTLLLMRGGHLVFACPASACPNPTTTHAHGALPWGKYYPFIAFGDYPFKVVDHPKYGVSVLLADGGRVATRHPHPRRTDGLSVMTEIFIHCGYGKQWRGSAGCPTIDPLFWKCFQHMLNVGESGRLIVQPLPAVCPVDASQVSA